MDIIGVDQIKIEPTYQTCDLQFLKEYPDGSITLAEFEEHAVKRLKVLRIFERVGLSHKVNSSKWRLQIGEEIRQADLTEFLLDSREDDLQRALRVDHVSHHILRLAFCRTEDLRRWFVANEVDFFRFKLNASSARDRFDNILKNHFHGKIKEFQETLTPELHEDILNTYYSLEATHVKDIDLYEVPFTDCLELVKSRNVYLFKGNALVDYNNLETLICSEIRRILSKSLALLSKTIHLVDEDERLAKILVDFDKQHTGNTFAAKSTGPGVQTMEQLDDASTTSFPLCMKSLHETVKKDYHLKHFGRLQLGLFFKGLALPMEEAIRFWRTYFTKKAGVDDGKFDKQYLYNIRHMYGKEGRKMDYTPYSCIKIIMSNVGPGETHGCPFKHEDDNAFAAKLVAAGVPATGMKEINELKQKHHYQIACQKYFEWTHNKATVDGGVNHPNQYFEESRKVLSGNFKIKTEVPESQPTIVPTKLYEKKKPISGAPVDDQMMMNILDDEDEIIANLDSSTASSG